MKTVKIPFSLFELLLDYFENPEFRSILMELYDSNISDHLLLYDDIQFQLRGKYDAMVKRQIYTQYKNETDPQKREELRKKYLDAAEIPPAFRSSVEIKDDLPF